MLDKDELDHKIHNFLERKGAWRLEVDGSTERLYGKLLHEADKGLVKSLYRQENLRPARPRRA